MLLKIELKRVLWKYLKEWILNIKHYFAHVSFKTIAPHLRMDGADGVSSSPDIFVYLPVCLRLITLSSLDIFNGVLF